MGANKGSDVGIALVVARVGALLEKPMEQSLVTLGEMSLHGSLQPMSALTDRLQLAIDNGARRVLLPVENKRDLSEVPGHVLGKLQIIFFSDPVGATFRAMGMDQARDLFALKETRAMDMKCSYLSTQSATSGVYGWINQNEPSLRLTARPWNRFEPENTEWWLVPSTDWPAYRHGKFFFKERNENRDLYCGLFVEKGLDPSIAVAYPSGKRLVMDDDWTWHRLLSDMASGQLRGATLEVIQRTGRPLLVLVDGGFVEDPASYDPDAPPMDWNYLSFRTDGAELEHISSDLTGTQFAEIAGCSTLADIAGAIVQMSHLEWTWIDVHLGAELEMAPSEYDPQYLSDAWDAAELWDRCLAPWQRWVT
jgi:hypothetical protein